MSYIHDLALIGKNVSFEDEVKIGAYAIVEDNVKIGKGTIVESHAILRSGSVIGKSCLVDSFAIIGALPQDESFDVKIVSGVIVGDNTAVREHATIHRSTIPSGFTKIGNNCMLQTGTHVAHDCEVGDGTVLANGSMLGGKVKLGQKCFIGGGAAIHQNVNIGDYVILSGNSATALDLPPYVSSAGISNVIGLNLIRLRREERNNDDIIALKKCFREFYKKNGIFRDRAECMLKEGYGTTKETKNFLNFFLMESKRGFAPKRHKIIKYDLA
jgi:UDP-N-acetylglucosamine acyltransferase